MLILDKLFEKYEISANGLRSGQQKTKCPRCQPEHNPHDNPLSITVDVGQVLFNCHHCGFAGGVTDDKYSAPKKIAKPSPVKVSETKDENLLDSYFGKRGISKDTYTAFDIYTEGKWIAFPYNKVENLCDNIKYKTVDKKFKQSKNAKKSLYNYGNVANANTVIIVEGEMDALSVYEAGYKNVTTLPDGAPSKVAYREDDKRFSVLQTHQLKANKIILFLDNDSAGDNLKKELLHRYGKDMCWQVRAPEGCKDANDVLLKHGKEKLKSIIDEAVPFPVEGLYRAGKYANDVLDLYNGNYDKPVLIGYKPLDDIYRIMKGTFHVWTGIPNHGKSTLLDQCLLKMAENHGWKFAVFSPEHSTKMHIRRLVSMLLGKPFEPNRNNRMTEDELKGAVNFIHNHFFFIETRDHTPNIDKILEIAKGAITKYGCNGLVMDPYNEIDASRRGSYREDEHIRDFISKCKRFSKMYDITTWVVAHPVKMQKTDDGTFKVPSAYDISGASHWNNQADAIVSVYRDFKTDITTLYTVKIREQGMYGAIGDCSFKFHTGKKRFEVLGNDY